MYSHFQHKYANQILLLFIDYLDCLLDYMLFKKLHWERTYLQPLKGKALIGDRRSDSMYPLKYLNIALKCSSAHIL